MGAGEKRREGGQGHGRHGAVGRAGRGRKEKAWGGLGRWLGRLASMASSAVAVAVAVSFINLSWQPRGLRQCKPHTISDFPAPCLFLAPASATTPPLKILSQKKNNTFL